MQTLAEADAPPGAMTSGTWVAVALSAGASLLHWIGTRTGTGTHNWSSDAVISLVAGAALMGLSILLVARPWSGRTARTLYLLGAMGTAVVVMAFLLPLLSGATSGHAGEVDHAGHPVEGGQAIAIVTVVRSAGEVALIGVLVWLHRMTAPAVQPEGY